MRLSVSTLVCPNWSFPQVVGAAAAHGIQGIDARGLGAEIDITKLDIFGANLDATLELLANHDLKIPCVNTSIALVTPATERWDMMLAECHRYAKLAGQLGSQFLRVFGGAVPKGMTRPEAASMARRHLRQLVKVCSAHHCQVLAETHDEWATSTEVMELLSEFAPEEAAALWDVEHPCRRGESPAQTARSLGQYARHIHFKDSVRRDGKSLPRLLGEGDLPLGEIIRALHSIEFDGWICLETEKRWHPRVAPEPEQAVPQFVHWMKENWRRPRPG